MSCGRPLGGVCMDCGASCGTGNPIEPRCRSCWLTMIKSRPKSVLRGTCVDCGCETSERRAKRCKACAGLARRAPRAHPDGYVRVWNPGHPMAIADGYVLEHRLVVYEAGIEVPTGYHVHHRNGVKHDNRLENLEVLLAGDHHRHHMRSAGFVVNQYGTWPVRDAYGTEAA